MTDIHPGSAGGAAGLTPPQALDAERSILAAMMLDASAVGRAIENIESSSFYRSAHAKMFEALIALYNRNEAADLITVAEELRRRGDFEAAGGAAGLAQIMEYATTTANLEHHIKIVHGKSILRSLIKATNEIQQQCYSGMDETASLLDQAESRIFAITDQRIRQGFSSIGALIMPTMTHIDQLFARKTQITGVPSGWDDLDKLTSGWQPGDLIILAGRPSMGKCVSWRTLVVNPRTGERMTIEECVRRRMPTVLGIDEYGVVRETKVSHWIDSGVKPVFRVSTKLGRSIEVTGHHPFLTTNGWQPLHDLAVGDSIGVPRIVPAAGTDETWSLERVRLLAGELRKELGQLQGLPTAVWTWGVERLRVFLAELVGVAGGMEPNDRITSVRLAVAVEVLGRDLQHAFLRIGVLTSLERSGDGGWQLVGVEPKGLREAGESTESGYNAHSNRAIRRERLERYATALADPELAFLASEDLFWDEITEITPLGAMQVYDLTVPDGANFLANDLCVHNTSAVMNMAENAAIRFNIPVAVFSLEMSKEQIALRLLCSQSEVSLQKVRTGYLGNEDWPRLTTGAGLLTQAPINIDDSAALSVLEIRAKCRRLKAENKLGLVIVDYLQLMRASGQVENRVQEISQISRGLKALAKELHVPIIALSQLSRAVEQRGGGGRPQLSDLRDSGCLTADSRVMRADTGAEVTMGELLASGERNIPVWTVDEAFRVVEGNMTHVFPSGVKEVFEMSLASGRTIKASANHPFLTLDGWRRLDQLQPGTRLATPRRSPEPEATTSWPDSEVMMLAHLLGDGCVAPRQPIHYTSSDLANVEAVEAAAAHFGITPRRVRQENWWHVYLPSPYHLTHGRRNPIAAWLDRFALYGKRSWEKFIPSAVFGLSYDQLRLFLRHLWATDGCVHDGGSQVRIYYASTSRRMIDDLQSLLLRFGIQGRIKVHRKPGYRDGWHLQISGHENQLRFLQEIGAHGKRGEIAERALERVAAVKACTNVDTVPLEVWSGVRASAANRGVTTRRLQAAIGQAFCGSTLYRSAPSRERLGRVALALRDPELHALSESGLFWDEIVSIRSLGEQPVFDATVEGTHNFIANGLVVHNSIEQDADVVMFVYREVVYKPDTAEPGKAQIIVAKQRNGPTDDVNLTFLRDCTKFVPYSAMMSGETDPGF